MNELSYKSIVLHSYKEISGKVRNDQSCQILFVNQ